MPRIAETPWLAWSADVTFLPASTPEKFAKAGRVLAEVVQKY